MSDAVVQRWDAFLEKTKARAVELMAEASGACVRNVAEGDCNPNTVLAGWDAIARRTTDLGGKVYDAWGAQVRAAMEGAGVTGERLEAERAKGDALRDWIELEVERTLLAVRCELARETIKREAAEARDVHTCTQCGAPLPLPIVFITTNVTCTHCRAINEYVPGTRTRMLAGHCMYDLPQLVAWPEYVVMTQAERACGRSPSDHAKRTLEGAKLIYHRKFLCARVELLPDEGGSFEAELRRATGAFYKGAIVVPSVAPLADLNDLRARMKKVLENAWTLVSTPMTSLTSTMFDNARAALVHYGAVKTNVDQMACTVCGAPRMRDARDLGPCVYCGGQLA